MFTKFFQGDETQKSPIKKYKQYRNIGKDLSQKILEKFTDEQSLLVVSKLLGIRQGKTLVLDSEEELNFIMDFSLFEYQAKGKTFLQRYKEETPELNEKEADIIEAKLLSYTSLFKILETDPAHASVTLGDILNDGKPVTILDINLSRSARPGLLIFTRIVPFSEFNMTSGMFCLFPENSERNLLKRYKIMIKKVKSEIESVRRFVAFFKLNRTEGLEAKTADI
jgi:hypothetical protein